MQDPEVRLDYDDNILDTIDKINAALKVHNLKLVDDEQAHDGFMLLKLTKLEKK